MTQEFYFQIIVTLLGIFGAVLCVILGWYLKKRETCNRRKEEIQERLVRKVDEMSAKLDHHIDNSKREIQRIGKAEQEIQRIGKLVWPLDLADSLIQSGIIAKLTAAIILIMSCVILGISLITKEVNQAVLTALVGIASSAGTFLFVKRDRKE